MTNSLLWRGVQKALLTAIMVSLGSLVHAQGASPAETCYVNNALGSDLADGLSAKPEGKSGPVATIKKGLEIAAVGARISIANTGVDYRETVKVIGLRKGRAATPLIIEGNGAAVSGLVEVTAARWNLLKDDIYWFENTQPDGKPGRMPKSNWLAFFKHQGWWSQPQAPRIFFLNGKPAPHTASLDSLPQGGFFYDTQTDPRKYQQYGSYRLYFRLPADIKLDACKIDVPLNSGVMVSDDYVVVRNLISRYSMDDGFQGYWGIGVVFENVNGSYNCDQGQSSHGTCETLIDGGLFEHNGGCGVADGESCVTVYRNVVVRDNVVGGAALYGLGHTFLNCRFYGNELYQVDVDHDASLSMMNCLMVGNGVEDVKATVRLGHGRGRLNHCTIVNSATAIQAVENVGIKNSVIVNCATLINASKVAMENFSLSKTLLGPGKVCLGDANYTADTIKELAKISKAKELFFDNPKLEGPLFLLTKDSPFHKAGDMGRQLGAVLPEYSGWYPLE